MIKLLSHLSHVRQSTPDLGASVAFYDAGEDGMANHQ